MSHAELGVLGGSFDPPHLGHVMLALCGLSVAGFARVLVAPTFEHAFGKPLTPFEHRLRMCQLAFAELGHVQISDVERELGGVSRTLRLVEALAAREPSFRLRLLIGSDILAETHRWQNFARIAELAPPFVADRASYEQPGASLVLPNISASFVRAALARGDDVSRVVPRSVLSYIAQHRLYAESA